MSKKAKVYAVVIVALSVAVFLLFGRSCQPQSAAAALVDKVRDLGSKGK